MSRDYYVYLHKTADTGVVFYVGKGVKSRLNETRDRSTEWCKMVEEHGFIPEVYLDGLTSDESHYKERELILNAPEDYQLVNTEWSKARSNSSTGILGVCYEEKSKQKWRKRFGKYVTETTRQITAHIYDSINKKQLSKTWSIKKLGYDATLELAKDWRLFKEKELLALQSTKKYETFEFKANKDADGNIILYDNNGKYLETILVSKT